MGNRAVITTRDNFNHNGIGIYLHWNGGRDSVEAFLGYCGRRKFRSFGSDNSYAFARLVQVISNYFGGSLSIGVDTIDHLDCDNGDNGTYIVDGWHIVGREYFDGQEQDYHELYDMMTSINARQPEEDQLLPEEVLAEEVRVKDLSDTDEILLLKTESKIEPRFYPVDENRSFLIDTQTAYRKKNVNG